MGSWPTAPSCVDMYRQLPQPCARYGLRVPASCAPRVVPEVQGRVPGQGTAGRAAHSWQPRACRA